MKDCCCWELSDTWEMAELTCQWAGVSVGADDGMIIDNINSTNMIQFVAIAYSPFIPSCLVFRSFS